MIEHISGFISVLKQSSPVFLIGISIACGAMLFLPDSIVSAIGLNDFRMANRGYIGGIFLFSTSLLIAQVGFWGIKSLRGLHERKQTERLQRKYLSNLTPDEKAYLVPFVKKDENTQYFGIQDGIAGGLDAKGIIYRSSNVGNLLAGVAYNIQPWAKNYLKNNPSLLEGANPLLPNKQKLRLR